MNTANVRVLLRTIGVLTIFAATIGASLTMIGTWSMNHFMQSTVPGMGVHVTVPDMSGYGILSTLVIALWGLILYVMSPAIARHITNDPGRVTVGADLPTAAT